MNVVFIWLLGCGKGDHKNFRVQAYGGLDVSNFIMIEMFNPPQYVCRRGGGVHQTHNIYLMFILVRIHYYILFVE